MGTEYFLLEENYNYKYGSKGSKLVQPKYNKRLIGKSSCGWAFQLRTYPDDKIYNIASWIELFEYGIILDGGDNIIEAETMFKLITDRKEFSLTGNPHDLKRTSDSIPFPFTHYEYV